jgi:hypothetical protein|uniref:Uncharacterized protein n=1 Tax=viral metagenome TaxID=1070528 RepID=A0A6C0BVF3_9ZZZZ
MEMNFEKLPEDIFFNEIILKNILIDFLIYVKLISKKYYNMVKPLQFKLEYLTFDYWNLRGMNWYNNNIDKNIVKKAAITWDTLENKPYKSVDRIVIFFQREDNPFNYYVVNKTYGPHVKTGVGKQAHCIISYDIYPLLHPDKMEQIKIKANKYGGTVVDSHGKTIQLCHLINS